MPLIANQSIRNGAGLGNKPLPSPAENPYSVPEKLNMFSAAWHSWWRAILPPEQK
jgi:hypothetical protein